MVVMVMVWGWCLKFWGVCMEIYEPWNTHQRDTQKKTVEVDDEEFVAYSLNGSCYYEWYTLTAVCVFIRGILYNKTLGYFVEEMGNIILHFPNQFVIKVSVSTSLPIKYTHPINREIKILFYTPENGMENLF